MSGNRMNLGQMFAQYQQEDQIIAVPAGTYDLEITSAKASVSNNGNETIRCVYKVVGANPHAGKKVMAGQFTLSEAARSIFFRNMACLGFDGNYFAQGPSLDDVAKALVGRTIRAELTVKQWQGEDRNEIPIGRIQLLSAPALPAIGGAPAVAAPAAAPAVPVAAPTPAPAVAAPAPVAEVAQPAPATVPVPAPAAVAPVPAPVAAVAAPAAAPVAAPVPAPTLAPGAPVAAAIAVEDPGF